VPAATIKAPGLHYYLSAQGCRAVLMSLSRRERSEFSPAAAMVRMDRFAPPILNRGQVAIMYIKQGGLREIVVGEESGYVKNRPALMGG
jgi:hypothetical protein